MENNNNLMDEFYDEEVPHPDSPAIVVDEHGLTRVADDKAYFQRDSKGRFGHGNLGKKAFSSSNGNISAAGEVKRILNEFMVEKLPELWDIWDKLPPDRKADLMIKLIKQTIPAPAESDGPTENSLTITLVEAKPKNYEDGSGTHEGVHEEPGSAE